MSHGLHVDEQLEIAVAEHMAQESNQYRSQLGLFENEDYYDGKGEEGDDLVGEDWDADKFECRCDTSRGRTCNCERDVKQELEWLQDTMSRLEGDIVAAEGRCRRWAAARGVPDDAVKDIYSYLLEDMANEWVLGAFRDVWVCGLL
jgi:hypothetical protein